MFAKERGPMPRTRRIAGREVACVGFLIGLQGPAPPGTVGCCENLDKACWLELDSPHA